MTVRVAGVSPAAGWQGLRSASQCCRCEAVASIASTPLILDHGAERPPSHRRSAPERLMEIQQVRDAIDNAFGRLPVPNPRGLIAHVHPRHPRDRRGEESIRRDLACKPWQSLPGTFLEERWASFCYL